MHQSLCLRSRLSAAEHSIAEWIYTRSESDHAPPCSPPLGLLYTHPFSLSIYVHLFLVTFGSHLHPRFIAEVSCSKEERVAGTRENAGGMQGTELLAGGVGREERGSLKLRTTLGAGAAHASLCSSWELPALKWLNLQSCPGREDRPAAALRRTTCPRCCSVSPKTLPNFAQG